ncbi:MAG: ATP-binding protein [Bacteroidales bacterium]|nr:ATP-binding protein [Bacteroidales bacterium]
MKENTAKKEKFDALKTFCDLSRELEGSKTAMFNLYMPEFYAAPNLSEDDEDDGDLPFGRRKRCHSMTLTASNIPVVKKELTKFAKYLKMSEIETLLVVAAYTRAIGDADLEFDMRDLVDYFDLNAVDFMPLRKYFSNLVEEGIFLKVPNSRRMTYKLETTLAEAIQNNTPYVKSERKEIDRYAFCRNVSDMIDERVNTNQSSRYLFQSVETLENQNPNMAFVQSVRKLVPDVEERTLFYECCDDFIVETRYRETGLESTLSDIYDTMRRRMNTASDLIANKHSLIVAELIEKSEGSFISEVTLRLTEKGKELFLEDDIKLYAKKGGKDKKLELPENIREKQMFYAPELKHKIDFLTQSLMEENFVNLQQRLEKESMPKGVAVIFYGVPGTGKTETAMQIARQTGRKVYHVDISASKSCWFGESEKIIKRIFTDYAAMCKDEEKKPILLFNEADALFSMRKDVNSSSVAQTENAIQNIILEELEKLDGILIATTNLADNLDPAFERRFVFKLKFDRPTLEAKQNIWQSKLAWLAEEQCRKLAADYDFSGGEIDNIVRKVIMDGVINGTSPDFSFIVEQCKSERLMSSKHSKIGF